MSSCLGWMITDRTGRRPTQSLIILQTQIHRVLYQRQGWSICWTAHSGIESWFPHLKDLSMHWFTRFSMGSESTFLSPLNWRSPSSKRLNLFMHRFIRFFWLCCPWLIVNLQFNCFLLMPIVDKLPVLLRQDLESAFEDEHDSIFDVTQLRQSLGQKKRELEIEVKRVCFFLLKIEQFLRLPC